MKNPEKLFKEIVNRLGLVFQDGSFSFNSKVGRAQVAFYASKSSVTIMWRWIDDPKDVSERLKKLKVWVPEYMFANRDQLNMKTGKWNWTSGFGERELQLFFAHFRDTLKLIEAKPLNKVQAAFILSSEMATKKRKKGMKPIPSRGVDRVETEGRNPSEFLRSVMAILFTVAYMERNSVKASPEVKKQLGKWMEDTLSSISIDGLPIEVKDMEDLADGIIDDSITGAAYGKMQVIGQAILKIDKEARHNERYTRRDLDLLSSIGGYFRNRSLSSWERVFRSVDLLGVPEVSMMYVPSVISAGRSVEIKQELSRLIKKLIDKPAKGQFLLTFQQASEFKAGHVKRPIYEKYMATQRELRAIWNKGALAVLRRANSTMTIDEFAKSMEANGFDYSYVPEGFTHKIGLNGKKIELFTIDDKPINGWPQSGRRIVMNTSYGSGGSNQYVFKAVDDETGLESSYYTYDHHRKSRTEKFKVVEQVMDDIESFQEKWERPLKSWQPGSKITIEVMQSAQAYFMYDHQARIGGKANMTDGKRTYGVTTWKVGHIQKLTETGFIVKYSGKKGIRQVHRVQPVSPIDKKVIALVNELAANKATKDPLWKTSIFSSADASGFRKWLKSLGFPSTPHKLRHAKGTRIAIDIIAKRVFKADETKSKDVQYRDATNFFKDQIATAVAKALGHKSATGEPLYLTSVKSYIDPSISRKWFSDRGFRPPNWIPKTDE